MKQDTQEARPGNGSYHEDDGIRFLVESALRSVASHKNHAKPASRFEWVQHLCDALISESDTGYRSVMSDLVLNGFEPDDIYQSVIPDAARQLGEMWLYDEATFVEVTTGPRACRAGARKEVRRQRVLDGSQHSAGSIHPAGHPAIRGSFARGLRRGGSVSPAWHLGASGNRHGLVRSGQSGGRRSILHGRVSRFRRETALINDGHGVRLRAGCRNARRSSSVAIVVDQVSTVADQTGCDLCCPDRARGD